MKKFVLEFLRRGFSAMGFGPIVLVVLYLILQKNGVINTLTVNEVCVGIVSITCLSFIAGGVNVIHKIETLPLSASILIHGIVLYVGYMLTYLVNDWLLWGKKPILIFTISFVVGYIFIWAIIYLITKSRTKKLNLMLSKKVH